MKMQGMPKTFVLLLCAAALLGGCAASGGSQRELPTSSDQTEAQKRARIRLQLAMGYYEQRQLNTALDEIKQALAADPDFADAYNVRALVYMDMGENRLADDNFQRALRLAPADADLANNYGWFLCQTGQPAQSIAYFDRALANRQYSSPGKALNNAGMCSLRAKKPAEAERYLLQAFQIEPGNPITSANLARLYYDRADYERARFHVGRAIKAELNTADVLWLAVKTEHKLGERLAEATMAAQLRRRHPTSPEYAAYQRGAFDE